jgi:hypothetical protein
MLYESLEVSYAAGRFFNLRPNSREPRAHSRTVLRGIGKG